MIFIIIINFNTTMKVEKILWRFIWLIFVSVCIYGIVTILNVNSDFDKHSCHITNITYPKSFNIEEGGWKNCTCNNEFCVGVCYCVKMYSNIKNGYLLQNTIGDDYEDPDCTFMSAGVPYNLNFQPFVNKYLNKTIDCWYQNDVNNIYINNTSSSYNYIGLIFCIILLIVVNMVCIFIEYISRNYGKNSEKNIQINTIPYTVKQ